MRAGLTGGIGAGKSEVARLFSEFGALVIDTDELSREATAPGSAGLREVAARWPQVVRDGRLDRAALAAIVFADPVARERLEAILHPHIRRLALEREAAATPGGLIVHVVPLLFETGYADGVEKVVLVVAPRSQRIARTVARDGIAAAAVEARMAAQIDPQHAARRADFVIRNDGDRAELRARARTVYDRLVATASGVRAGGPGERGV